MKRTQLGRRGWGLLVLVALLAALAGSPAASAASPGALFATDGSVGIEASWGDAE